MDTAVNMPAFEQTVAPAALEQDSVKDRAFQAAGQVLSSLDAFWATEVMTKQTFMSAVRAMDKFWSTKIG